MNLQVNLDKVMALNISKSTIESLLKDAEERAKADYPHGDIDGYIDELEDLTKYDDGHAEWERSSVNPKTVKQYLDDNESHYRYCRDYVEKYDEIEEANENESNEVKALKRSLDAINDEIEKLTKGENRDNDNNTRA